jgi:hypothetical protein
MQEGIGWMNADKYPIVSIFDHVECKAMRYQNDNLGGSDTAMLVVNWIIEQDMDTLGGFIPTHFSFVVHSANSVGADNIQRKLDNYLKFWYNFLDLANYRV